MIVGIIADLIRTNRMLIEDTLEHTKKMRFGRPVTRAAAPSEPATGQDRFTVEAGQR